MDIVFVHGWASGAFIWDSIIDEFKDHNCHTVNLGFIGKEEIAIPEGKFIGIGHSLGGPWLLKHYPEQMIGFISIASFNCFYQHVPQQILRSMRKNITKDMTAQLIDFWKHAGLDDPRSFKNLNLDKLIKGLNWLSQWDIDIPSNLPVKSLASRDDQIVSEKMSQYIWNDYDIQWIDKGGHMLPLTQSKWCIEEITKFINDEK